MIISNDCYEREGETATQHRISVELKTLWWVLGRWGILPCWFFIWRFFLSFALFFVIRLRRSKTWSVFDDAIAMSQKRASDWASGRSDSQTNERCVFVWAMHWSLVSIDTLLCTQKQREICIWYRTPVNQCLRSSTRSMQVERRERSKN